MSNVLSCQSRGYLKAQEEHNKKNDCSSLRDTQKKIPSIHDGFAESWFRVSVLWNTEAQIIPETPWSFLATSLVLSILCNTITATHQLNNPMLACYISWTAELKSLTQQSCPPFLVWNYLSKMNGCGYSLKKKKVRSQVLKLLKAIGKIVKQHQGKIRFYTLLDVTNLSCCLSSTSEHLIFE